ITLGASERNWLERRKSLEATELTFDTVKPSDIVQRARTPRLGADPSEARKAFEKTFFVGLHYPGASVGYRTSFYSSVELRGSASSDITVVGGRFNYRVIEFGSTNLFLGTQASHVSFVGEVSEGTGLLGGGFFGVQQYFSDYLSFRADFGSYVMTLEDEATGVSDTGLGFALNTGLTVHFL
ncbi:MAG: hypothetical protein ABEK50_13685, partial [bacterium]